MTPAAAAQAAVRVQVRGFIEANFLYMRPDVDLGDDDDLMGLGIIDSLGFVELVDEVQSRHGIEVHDAEITEENFGSVSAVARFVATKQRP